MNSLTKPPAQYMTSPCLMRASISASEMWGKELEEKIEQKKNEKDRETYKHTKIKTESGSAEMGKRKRKTILRYTLQCFSKTHTVAVSTATTRLPEKKEESARGVKLFFAKRFSLSLSLSTLSLSLPSFSLTSCCVDNADAINADGLGALAVRAQKAPAL